ncbi:MAG: hypothetical protein LBS18_00950 [Clostridiales bacterium]|jgi:hypothetical protein|nr:hypothetical protein [Clostridiales bacterium]
MKRLFSLLVIAILLAAGCGKAQTPRGFVTPAFTPMPTPTPRPVFVLCVMDCAAEDAPEFFRAFEEETETSPWVTKTLESPAGFDETVSPFLRVPVTEDAPTPEAGGAREGEGGALDGEAAAASPTPAPTPKTRNLYDGIIALRTRADTSLDVFEEAVAAGVCVTVLDITQTGARVSPEGVAYTAYEPGDLVELAMRVMLAYPPHDTPVRLLGMFREEGSAAERAYQDNVAQGKIFSRGEYYGADGEDAAKFLRDQLDVWVEGMLDAIFVEELTTAKIALDVLAAQNRADAEVFLAPAGVSMATQRGMHRRYVFPVAIGPDIYEQSLRQVRVLRSLLAGKPADNERFGPTVDFMDEQTGGIANGA